MIGAQFAGRRDLEEVIPATITSLGAIMRTVAIPLIILLATACRYRPEPIPIQGDRTEIARLAGTWIGEYTGTSSGRSGNITFTLKAGTDSAFGDVLMVPAGTMNPILPADNPTDHRVHARSPQVLQVSFVSIAGGRVSGTLEPYVAPDCSCTVRTTFTGVIATDVIDGTFVTRGPSGLEQTGRWRVMRR
jgi:hypothetical protein